MERRTILRNHIRKLNDQFYQWIKKQHETNSYGVWTPSCNEYIKYLKELEIEFSDVLSSKALPANGGTAENVQQLLMFGTGDCGQLGFGEDILEQPIPKQLNIKNLSVVEIICGGMHTVAITSDGRVWTWGVNDEGALGRSAKSANQWVANMQDNSSMASSGGVSETEPGPVNLPNTFKAVQGSAGDSHTFVLSSSGEVWGWGTFRNSSGVLGFSKDSKIQNEPIKVPIISGSRFLQIASGSDHVMALNADGEVYSWGCSEKGRLGRLVESVADKSPKEDRSIIAECLSPSKVPLSAVKHIACGFFASFAVTKDSQVYGWGINNYGQLGTSDEGPFFSPKVISALGKHDIRSISSGEHHTLALTRQGSVISFGRPTYGRLGRSDVRIDQDDFEPNPKFVEGISGRVASIETGIAVSGAVNEDGEVYVWGYGTVGQLGKADDEEDEKLPFHLSTKRLKKLKATKVVFGGQHSAIIAMPRQDGQNTELPGQPKKRSRLGF